MVSQDGVEADGAPGGLVEHRSAQGAFMVEAAFLQYALGGDVLVVSEGHDALDPLTPLALIPLYWTLFLTTERPSARGDRSG